MRRWNGWGETDIDYPVSPTAFQFLNNRLGALHAPPDASLAAVLATIPASRLPPHPQIDATPEPRLRHARGQSLPDWIALRTGRISAVPDGVATPTSAEGLRALLAFASQAGSSVIPFGGGTSVVGHINPRPRGAPVLTINLRQLDRLLDLDPTSRLATIQAGASGPELERQLNANGFTLGHFPQSFEYATLGGWIATRSSGQQSYYYGRIEDLFAGGRLETPRGPLVLPAHPASAAGPDLRQLVLGSEGRLGIITQAVVRVRPVPETEAFFGVFFKSWEAGVAAIRDAVQNGLAVSMLRLSDPLETEITLRLAGHDRLVVWAKRGLDLLRLGPDRCLLIYGLTGPHRIAARTQRQAKACWRAFGGLFTGPYIGKAWQQSRFRTPYLRNTLWEAGLALDTLETAVAWRVALPAAQSIKAALEAALLEVGERALVFCHLSHLYPDGVSIYVTYLFRRTADPDKLLERWHRMKAAATRAILGQGGTISHHHGIGKDHVPYLPAENSVLGMNLLQSIMQTVDPENLMNPGTLLADRTLE